LILAGDVGGTKCNLALVEQHAGGFRFCFKNRFATRDYSGFDRILGDFLAQAQPVLSSSTHRRVLAAGFGVAGAVVEGRVALTNLSWGMESDAIRRQLGTDHVVLLNDMEATGYSLPWLGSADLYTLNVGTSAREAAQALIAAGTGLGESILRWNGSRYQVEPGEGGHCDFAPRTEKEIELLRYMKRTEANVSFELILSGRGFFTIHQFLDPALRHPSFEAPGGDPAPEITRLALAKSCPVCVETLDLWTSLYGAEAGNLALKALARGGVFVGGGIVTKILPKIKDGAFFRAFCEKSKFSSMLSQIPIKVLLNEEAPLVGAAAEAARALAV
jgi:glucokinase